MSTSQVPVYGNYHGYYLKRPTRDDPRLALLPPALFPNARVLDVGCNEGWVTCEMAQKYRASHALGVDIDDALVRAAWRRRKTVWSLQAPDAELTASVARASGKRKRTEATSSPEPDYFPASCEQLFGAIPIPPAERRDRNEFPHNVSFRNADWVNEFIPEDAEGYDVVLALSVSKWIHLNCGDDGLLVFFRKVHCVLRTGGAFVLEPQPWDSYHKAKRMDKRLKETGQNLKLRPDDFESLLRDIGFREAQHFGAAGTGGFRRPVDMYIKV